MSLEVLIYVNFDRVQFLSVIFSNLSRKLVREEERTSCNQSNSNLSTSLQIYKTMSKPLLSLSELLSNTFIYQNLPKTHQSECPSPSPAPTSLDYPAPTMHESDPY